LPGVVQHDDRKTWLHPTAFLQVQSGALLFQNYLIGTMRKRRIGATRKSLINSPVSLIQSGVWVLGRQTACGKLIFAVQPVP